MRFMVFDLPGDPGTFTERVLHMRSLLDAASVAWLRPVAQYRARDAAELDALLEAVVAGGGEGLMLQHQDARYRVGRSGGLLKYKPYDDRSEEHTSELQSLMRLSHAVFCLTKNNNNNPH